MPIIPVIAGAASAAAPILATAAPLISNLIGGQSQAESQKYATQQGAQNQMDLAIMQAALQKFLQQQNLTEQKYEFGKTLEEKEKDRQAQEDALEKQLGFSERQLTSQEKQQAAQLGLSEEQFKAQKEQFAQQLGLNKEQLAAQKEQAAGQLSLGQEQLDLEKQKTQASQEAYKQAIARATGELPGAESAFLSATEQQSPELAQMRKDIQSGADENIQRAMSEYGAGLSKEGVHGGQAGTLMGRQIGNLRTQAGRDINQLAYQDYQNRLNQKLGYLGGKAGTAQKAAYMVQ